MSRRAEMNSSHSPRRAVSLPFLLEGWAENVPPIPVSGLCRDLRRLRSGDAFIARSAAELSRARAAGAAVVLHDAGLHMAETADAEHALTVFAVDNLEQRLPALAARFHHHPADQVSLAAVSGHAGRTAAAWYIAQSWQRSQGRAGLIGSLGRGLFASPRAPLGRLDVFGLHDSLAACTAGGAETVALEVTQAMLNRNCLADLPLDVAVYSGSGPDDDASGLLPLFDRHAPRFAVINHDAAGGKWLASRARSGVQVLTFGSNGATELQGSILAQDSSGMTVRVASPWGGGELRTGLLGSRNLSGLLAAAGALALMGMPWNRVMHQLEIMSPVPGRLSCITGEGARPAAVIDHARSPAALEQVLHDLRSHLHGRLYCILNTAGVRRHVLAEVAAPLADEVFEVLRSNRSAVLRSVLARAGRHDIVLIAGGGQGDWARSGEAEIRHLLEEAA